MHSLAFDGIARFERLPEWQELAEMIRHDDLAALEPKILHNNWRLRTTRRVLRTITRTPGLGPYASVVERRTDEIAMLFRYLVVASAPRPEGLVQEPSSLGKPKRTYRQLPCTPPSVQGRVRRLRSLAAWHEPILLLGDDDLLSVALVKAGYSNITVIDIDPRVLENATRLGKVQGHEWDLRRGLPKELHGKFRVVEFDPPYELAWVRTFLAAALVGLDESEPARRIVMHLSLPTLGLKGYEELRRLLDEQRLVTTELELGANRYDLPKTLRWAIAGVVAGAGAQGTLKRHGISSPTYFASDTLTLAVR